MEQFIRSARTASSHTAPFSLIKHDDINAAFGQPHTSLVFDNYYGLVPTTLWSVVDKDGRLEEFVDLTNALIRLYPRSVAQAA